MWQSLGKGLCQAQGRHPCLLICIIDGLSECCAAIFFSNYINLGKRVRDDIDMSTVQIQCIWSTDASLDCNMCYIRFYWEFCRTFLFVCTGLVNICWFNLQQMCCIKQTGIGLSKIPETHILARVYKTLNAIFHSPRSVTTINILLLAHEVCTFG